MAIKQEDILNALRHVDDPDLKKDLVTLNMIRNVAIDGNKVSFEVVLTTPACPLKEKIRKDCLDAVAEHVSPDLEVSIEMTSEVTSLNKSQKLPNVKNIIAVVSGKGGVGKSTVAANLAVSLALEGAKVGLVDADIYGPSMPIMFGLRDAKPQVVKKDERDLLVPFEKHGIKLMSIGFLVQAGQAIVWRGPMASKAMSQLIFDSDWGELDYLVMDMPPGTGDLHLTLVQQLPVTGVVLVTTPQDVAIADARKGAEMFRTPQINVPIMGVIENMAWFTPEDAPDKKYFIFGKGGGKSLADSLEVPVIGQIPIVEKARELGDEGRPPALDQQSVLGSSFKHLAQTVARQIALRNAEMPPTQQVEILYT